MRVRAARALPWLREGSPPGTEGHAVTRAALKAQLHCPQRDRTGGCLFHQSPPGIARGGTPNAPPVRPGIPSGAGSRGRTLSQPAGTTREVSPPRWPQPGGIGAGGDPGGLGLRPLAHDSAESGAAAGEHRGKVLVPRDARIRVEEMLLHVLGRRLLGLLVGGAAGSPQGHGPGSPCTWPVQPLRQAYEWKTPFLHALVKRTNL